MRRSCLLSLLAIGGLLILAGCQSTSPIADEAVGEDTTRVYTQAVHVLVDGDDVGTIPRTIRVRRGMGNRKVSLWQAGEEFRVYEIEFAGSVAGEQTLQGFWSNSSMEGESFDVRTLPNNGEGTFYVPYAQYPIKVEDHTYGVTLLVED